MDHLRYVAASPAGGEQNEGTSSSAATLAIKFQAGYAVLSGVCAHEAAERAYASAIASGKGDAESGAAADTAFIAASGLPFARARHAFTEVMSSNQNAFQVALDAARSVFVKAGGNEAFDPVLEIAEGFALSQAKRVMLEHYPDSSSPEWATPAQSGEGDQNGYEDAVKSAIDAGVSAHKDYHGHSEGATVRKVLLMCDSETRFATTFNSATMRAAADLAKASKHFKDAIAAEERARADDIASGTRPDFQFLMDMGVNTSKVREF